MVSKPKHSRRRPPVRPIPVDGFIHPNLLGAGWQQDVATIVQEFTVRHSILRKTLEEAGVKCPTSLNDRRAVGMNEENTRFVEEFGKVVSPKEMHRLMRETIKSASLPSGMRKKYGRYVWVNIVSGVMQLAQSTRGYQVEFDELGRPIDKTAENTVYHRIPMLSFFFTLEDIKRVPFFRRLSNWRNVVFENNADGIADPFTAACLVNCFQDVIKCRTSGAIEVIKLTPRNSTVREVWKDMRLRALEVLEFGDIRAPGAPRTLESTDSVSGNEKIFEHEHELPDINWERTDYRASATVRTKEHQEQDEKNAQHSMLSHKPTTLIELLQDPTSIVSYPHEASGPSALPMLIPRDVHDSIQHAWSAVSDPPVANAPDPEPNGTQTTAP